MCVDDNSASLETEDDEEEEEISHHKQPSLLRNVNETADLIN